MGTRKTKNTIPDNSGTATSANIDRFFTTSDSEKQSAVVYDALSEGPIQGLVNGPASIMMNGVPLMEKDTNFLNKIYKHRDSLEVDDMLTAMDILENDVSSFINLFK